VSTHTQSEIGCGNTIQAYILYVNIGGGCE